MGLKETLAFNRLIDKFGKDISDTYYYKIRCISTSDYEIYLEYKAKSKVLNSLFGQVGMQLGRMHPKFSKLIVSNSSMIESYDVPDNLLNRVHTSIHKNLKAIAKEVKRDGVEIIRSKVEKCTFKQNEEDLKILIEVSGQYVWKK